MFPFPFDIYNIIILFLLTLNKEDKMVKRINILSLHLKGVRLLNANNDFVVVVVVVFFFLPAQHPL